MKIKYMERKFTRKNISTVNIINDIISEYSRQGYELTLRQTYYQLVARGVIENTERSYKRTGELISNARLAGLISWDAITDRTRNLKGGASNLTPEKRIELAAQYFHLSKWTHQPNYVEIWVEKDALIDVVGRACFKTDTPYFSCRGYCSQSEMWQAAQRFIRRKNLEGRYIIYLGDHDPSGVDMPRDIAERMKLFGADVEIKRVALTMEQIHNFNPPPNPAKITDTRFKAYIKKYGQHCWELDALEPVFLSELIDAAIRPLMDDDIVAQTLALEARQREELRLISDNYHELIAYLKY